METQIKQLKTDNAKLKGVVKSFIDYLDSDLTEAEAYLKDRAKEILKEIEQG